MSEMLSADVYIDEGASVAAAPRPDLHLVPDVRPIVPAAYDPRSGRVERPAINVKTELLANGQPLSVFFDRGYTLTFDQEVREAHTAEVELRIARALSEATKLYQQN